MIRYNSKPGPLEIAAELLNCPEDAKTFALGRSEFLFLARERTGKIANDFIDAVDGLYQNTSETVTACVAVQREGFSKIWASQDGQRDQRVFQRFKTSIKNDVPRELYVFARELNQRLHKIGEIRYEPTLPAHHTDDAAYLLHGSRYR